MASANNIYNGSSLDSQVHIFHKLLEVRKMRGCLIWQPRIFSHSQYHLKKKKTPSTSSFKFQKCACRSCHIGTLWQRFQTNNRISRLHHHLPIGIINNHLFTALVQQFGFLHLQTVLIFGSLLIWKINPYDGLELAPWGRIPIQILTPCRNIQSISAKEARNMENWRYGGLHSHSPHQKIFLKSSRVNGSDRFGKNNLTSFSYRPTD
jgi:hypothetical protein